jgi:hypothetical protein
MLLTDAVKVLVSNTMDRCPQSIDEFKAVAGQTEDVSSIFSCSAY